MTRFSLRFVALASSAILVGCGGGDNSSPPPIGTPAPTPVPSPSPSPTPTPTPSPSATVQNLSEVTVGLGYRITGVSTNDSVGRATTGVGDINGDGFADYAVGVADGRIAVVFGSASSPGTRSGDKITLDYNSISPSRGFLVTGSSIVAGVGDLNNDGFDEIAFSRPTEAANAGEVYVIYGKSGQFGSISGDQARLRLPDITPSQGFVARGDDGGDAAGTSISSAGDVNGDGFEDLLIGAPYADETRSNQGSSYIVFGKAGTFGTPAAGRSILFLGALPPGEGVKIVGGNISALGGFSVAPLGDFNGDGIDDIVIGAPGDTTLYPQGGAAYVIFGTKSAFGPVVNGQTTVLANELNGTRGFIVAGDEGTNAGETVRRAGDVNGDGRPDLLIAARQPDSFGATGFVVYGSSSVPGETISGRRVLNLAFLMPAVGFVIKNGAVGNFAAGSVDGAGDFNGDGLSDLLFGNPESDFAGSLSGVAYLLFGKSTQFGTLADGRDTVDLAALSSGQGIVFRAEGTRQRLGFTVAGIRDVNRDGKSDILLGSPGGLTGTEGPGSAFVLYGR